MINAACFPRYGINKRVSAEAKYLLLQYFLQKLRRVVPPSHSVPCSKLMHGIGWLFLVLCTRKIKHKKVPRVHVLKNIKGEKS